MAANTGWFYFHFESEYFSPVWFAPGDETGIPEEELRPEYYGGGAVRARGRKRLVQDDLSVSEVEAQWDLLHARLAAQTRNSAIPVQTVEDVQMVPMSTSLPIDRQKTEQSQFDDDEAILAFLLVI
jgi:hypothetical protein